jgi:hypothetical protein
LSSGLKGVLQAIKISKYDMRHASWSSIGTKKYLNVIYVASAAVEKVADVLFCNRVREV